jgi:hypothetical protein
MFSCKHRALWCFQDCWGPRGGIVLLFLPQGEEMVHIYLLHNVVIKYVDRLGELATIVKTLTLCHTYLEVWYEENKEAK